jgi:hypothetical protein
MNMWVDGARFYFEGNEFKVTSIDGSQFCGFCPGRYSGHKAVFDVSEDEIKVGVGGGSIQFGI